MYCTHIFLRNATAVSIQKRDDLPQTRETSQDNISNQATAASFHILFLRILYSPVTKPALYEAIKGGFYVSHKLF